MATVNFYEPLSGIMNQGADVLAYFGGNLTRIYTFTISKKNNDNTYSILDNFSINDFTLDSTGSYKVATFRGLDIGFYKLRLTLVSTNTYNTTTLTVIQPNLVQQLSFDKPAYDISFPNSNQTYYIGITIDRIVNEPIYSGVNTFLSYSLQPSVGATIANIERSPTSGRIGFKYTVPGTYTLTATTTDGTNLSASTVIKAWPFNTVVVTGLSMTPDTITIPARQPQLLTCDFEPVRCDLTQVSWTSSDPVKAPITDTGTLGTNTVKATVTPTEPGTYTITCLSTQGNNISATSVITVSPYTLATSLTMDKDSAALAVGSKVDLTCTIEPATARNTIIWSADPDTVTFSNKTTPTAVTSTASITPTAKGTITIKATASDGSNKFASTVLTVTDAIKVTYLRLLPPKITIYAKQSQDFTCTIGPYNATNKTITLTSSDPVKAPLSNILQIDPLTVRVTVTTNDSGSFTITAAATDGSLKTFISNIEAKAVAVTSISLNLEMDTVNNRNRVVRSNLLPENATYKTLTWTSSNNAVATITNLNDGTARITALTEGKVTITSTTTNSKSSTILVNVKTG